MPTGSYRLTARAYDNYGLQGNATASFTVAGGNNPPTAILYAPATGVAYTAVYPATASIALSAYAYANNGGAISKVEFYRAPPCWAPATAAHIPSPGIMPGPVYTH